MNKKMIVYLSILISLVSVILIAVWGTLPESTNASRIESLFIDEYDETNEDGDKFKDVAEIIDENNRVYIIHYEFTPSDAAYDITASSSRDDVTIQIDDSNQNVYVYFDLSAVGKTVTIRIIDNETQKYDEITLWFKTPGVIVVPEI